MRSRAGRGHFKESRVVRTSSIVSEYPSSRDNRQFTDKKSGPLPRLDGHTGRLPIILSVGEIFLFVLAQLHVFCLGFLQDGDSKRASAPMGLTPDVATCPCNRDTVEVIGAAETRPLTTVLFIR